MAEASVFAPEGVVEVKSMTAKEIKTLAKPEFAASPEKFYPTETVKRFGFHRAKCPVCGNNYWRHSEKQGTCGDSACVGSYTFIGRQTGIGKDHRVTYSEAWETLKTSLENARIPHTAIKRYPVVARWRQDVDFVAAGIFCFQPFCVTGELDPPANPLCCPQFCLRFNDLDSIGLTGRHYSGFIMLGIQVFNKPDKYVYFKEECTEFNLNWLINVLKIDPDEITLIEDVWAGGGNLGPSMEYFVSGLEVGNMVFMQYKTFPDGSREELQVKVIDVGIGLERIPWLLNGTPTSYVDVFPSALQILTAATGVHYTNDTWNKFGPLSCLLNADEVADMDQAWEKIAAQLGMPVAKLKQDVQTVRDLYIVADHTRTVMIAIEDGSLPSNTGGAANLRNVLRRVFHTLKRNNWWDKLGMDGLMAVFDAHRKDLTPIYGPFAPYPSFRQIIEIEFERWQKTDEEAQKKLKRLIERNKGKPLTIANWIEAMTTYGLDPDRIAEITKQEVPATLYAELAQHQERTARATLRQLYDTVHLPPTEELFYAHPPRFAFDASVVAVFNNVQQENRTNIVILDKTCFYPLGGGQEHDTGVMTIAGEEYQVVDVMKVGKAIMHVLDRPVDRAVVVPGTPVHGKVNQQRREALRNHHTATHVLSAACRKVLGPHVWQQGAKKTEQQAHLDITHFRALTYEEEVAIENECNRITRAAVDVHKYEMPKEKAELKFGFSLYQGGVVPGSSLRIVDIEGVDQEACCGTHCDNTAEIGFVRIIKTQRISDGVVRLYFVAGDRAIAHTNFESSILHQLSEAWSVQPSELVATAERFFKGFKEHVKLASAVANLSLKVAVYELLQRPEKLGLLVSDADSPTQYISAMPSYAARLKAAGKGLLVVGDTFIYGLLGDPAAVDLEQLKKEVAANAPAAAAAASAAKYNVAVKTELGKGKDKVDGIVQLQAFAIGSRASLCKWILSLNAVELKP